jgi:hypothetical protein
MSQALASSSSFGSALRASTLGQRHGRHARLQRGGVDPLPPAGRAGVQAGGSLELVAGKHYRCDTANAEARKDGSLAYKITPICLVP